MVEMEEENQQEHLEGEEVRKGRGEEGRKINAQGPETGGAEEKSESAKSSQEQPQKTPEFSEKMWREFREDMEKVLVRFREQNAETITKLNEKLNEILEQLKSRKGADSSMTEALTEEIGNLKNSIEGLNNQYTLLSQAILKLAQVEVPEALATPTPERILNPDQIKKIIKGKGPEEARKALLRNSDYHSGVRNWFEERIREIETSGLTFEQHENFRYLLRALTELKSNPETRPLANEIDEMLKSRRTFRLLVGLWGLSQPNQIAEIGGRFAAEDLRRIFTTRTLNGEPLIAKSYLEYEKMAAELERKRGVLETEIRQIEESMKNEEQKALPNRNQIAIWKKELEQKRDEYNGYEIKQFYIHGGTDGGRNIDEVIRELELRRANGEEIDQGRLNELKELFWARRMAGELWSITFRAGYHNVQLNGDGDYSAARIMNFTEFLEKRKGFAMKTKGFWMGNYPPNQPPGPLDLGFRDFFTGILSGFDKDELLRLGIKEEDIIERGGEIIGLRSLETLDVTNDELWNKITRNERAYAERCLKFSQADDTRSAFWGPDSFLDDPSIEKFLELKKFFKHIPESRLEDGFFRELVERYILWMLNDPKAHQVQEELLLARLGQVSNLIEKASEREFFSNQVQNELLRKYLHFPILSNLSARAGAGFVSTVDFLWGLLWRYPETRAEIFFRQWPAEWLRILGNFLRGGLEYVFAK